MPHSVEKEFTFSFSSKERRSKLTVPVTIPLVSSPAELVGQLHKMHNLPCYVIDGKLLLDELFLLPSPNVALSQPFPY